MMNTILRTRLPTAAAGRSARTLGTLATTEKFAVDIPTTSTTKTPTISANTLSNGIKIITNDSVKPLVSMNVAILGGSSAESASEKGAAQLLARAALSGSADRTGLATVRELEALGASVSTSVDREKIVYSLTVEENNLAPAVDIIMTAIAEPPYAEHVLAESKEVAFSAYPVNDTHKTLNELVHEAAYGGLSPFGVSIYSPDLNTLSTKDILAYREKTFVSNNLVITADGVSKDVIENVVATASKSLPKASTATSPSAAKYIGGECKIRTPATTSSIALGFQIPGGNANKPFYIVNGALKSAGFSTFVNNYSFGGVMGVYVSSVDELNNAISVVKGLASTSEKDLTSVIKAVALDNAIAMDGKDAANSLVSSYVQGINFVDMIASLKSANASDISKAAAAMLNGKPCYASIGGVGLPTMTEVEAMMK